MERILLLNVGWMNAYKGVKGDPLKGGGDFPSRHGYGMEILNFEPFYGHMYGFAKVPHNSIRIERLGAPSYAKHVDIILVIWVTKSRIVGWYRHATVYRMLQEPPKSSHRKHKGGPIKHNVMSKEGSEHLLDPDDRLFEIPRSRMKKGAMGRYLWYIDEYTNTRFRKKLLHM